MKKISILIAFAFISLNSVFANNSLSNVSSSVNRSLVDMEVFQLGSLFKNHMVLQRGMNIPVWGKATAGATITIRFAEITKQTTVDVDGKWRLDLASLEASFEPRTMIITSSKHSKTIEVSDILVGEVWICSGQSNMQFGINGAPEVKALVPSAKNIRSFTVKNTVAFEPQDTCEGEWINEQPNSAVAFAFAYFLEKNANVPVGIILTSWGSSSIEAWMPREMTTTVPHFKIMMKEFDADVTTQNKIKEILEGSKPWSNTDDIFLRRQTNVLYNAMMHPLIPYACRGLVWYQGERNTQSMNGMLKEPWFSRNSGILAYGNTLKEWILNYRKSWGNKKMQFQIVMLPGYGGLLDSGPNKKLESPEAHSWAWMRESQLKALELCHTTVINTIDLGDVKNIHPNDKLPIGERLALFASNDLSISKKEAFGPIYKKVKKKNNTLIIHYKHAKELRTTDGKEPRAFWLSDDSKKWVQAEAKIIGTTIVLSSSELAKPKYIRYAFTGKPDVNLVNEANLPAYPFRTDTFKP